MRGNNRALGNDSLHEERNDSTAVNLSTDLSTDLQISFDSFAIERADPRIPCFMVDTFVRNEDFFGRNDTLAELDHCLLPSGDFVISPRPGRARVALLYGMGGLGKTETAIEYAYSRRDKFDAIFWIRSDVDQHDSSTTCSTESSKLESDIAQIAVRLGINDPDEPDNKATNKANALEWLSNPFKVEHNTESPRKVPATWLMIFDNADEPKVLEPYRGISESGAVLITSRDPNARSSLSPFASVIDIGLFSGEESGAFVQKLTEIPEHSDEARKVGERLGGLPIALAQMAGLIRLEHLSYQEFLDIYDDTEHEAEIQAKEVQPRRETARGNLSTIWALEKLTDTSRAVLQVASLLDPDRIQESLLLDNASLATIKAYPKKRDSAFFEAQHQLIGSSLVRHNQEIREYWMHRVTQDVIRTRIPDGDRGYIFSNVVFMVFESLWTKSEALYPHVESVMKVYFKYFDGKAATKIDDMTFATLLSRAAW